MKHNMENCPKNIKCSKNLCPLDINLHLRVGKHADKCPYMREPKTVKICGHEFISGGKQMPDVTLNFVPESNVTRLNEASMKRWHELKK